MRRNKTNSELWDTVRRQKQIIIGLEWLAKLQYEAIERLKGVEKC